MHWILLDSAPPGDIGHWGYQEESVLGNFKGAILLEGGGSIVDSFSGF